MDPAVGWMHRNERRIQWAFLALNAALFLYSALDAGGLLGGEPGFHPRRMVYGTGGMLLQPVAALVGYKRPVAYFVLIAGSMTLLGMSFFTAV